MQLLESMVSSVMQQPLKSDREFWSADKTLKVLAAREELRGAEGVEWPAALRRFMSPSKNFSIKIPPKESFWLKVDQEVHLSFYFKFL